MQLALLTINQPDGGGGGAFGYSLLANITHHTLCENSQLSIPSFSYLAHVSSSPFLLPLKVSDIHHLAASGQKMRISEAASASQVNPGESPDS